MEFNNIISRISDGKKSGCQISRTRCRMLHFNQPSSHKMVLIKQSCTYLRFYYFKKIRHKTSNVSKVEKKLDAFERNNMQCHSPPNKAQQFMGGITAIISDSFMGLFPLKTSLCLSLMRCSSLLSREEILSRENAIELRWVTHEPFY